MSNSNSEVNNTHSNNIGTSNTEINESEISKTPITISIVGAGGKTQLSYWLAEFFKELGHQVCVTTTTKMYLPETNDFDNMLDINSDYDKHLNNEDIEKLAQELFSSDNAHTSKTDSYSLTSKSPSTSFIYKNKLSSEHVNVIGKDKVKGLSLSQIENIRVSGLFTVIIIEADGANHLPIKAPAAHEPCIVKSSNIVIAVTGAEAIFSQANRNNIQRWPQFSKITHCNEGMTIDQAVLKPLINNPQGMFKGAPDLSKKIWVINKYDLSNNPDKLLQIANNLLNEGSLLTSVWLTQLNSLHANQKAAIKKVLVKQ